MFEDRTLVCEGCGNEFVFTAGEQQFYAEKGFENDPKRCPDCRKARKEEKRARRETFIGVCADCGGEAKVPFTPKEGEPIYCSACFAIRNPR